MDRRTPLKVKFFYKVPYLHTYPNGEQEVLLNYGRLNKGILSLNEYAIERYEYLYRMTETVNHEGSGHGYQEHVRQNPGSHYDEDEEGILHINDNPRYSSDPAVEYYEAEEEMVLYQNHPVERQAFFVGLYRNDMLYESVENAKNMPNLGCKEYRKEREKELKKDRQKLIEYMGTKTINKRSSKRIR